MTSENGKIEQRRNKGYEATHRALIEAAVRILSEKGAEALSIAAVARAVGINRTTIYYHFESREALLAAVKHWSGEQLARGFSPEVPQKDRIEFIARFVLENPELLNLWIEDFISPGDIRESYPEWDGLVAGTGRSMAAQNPGETFDAEVYCVIMLTAAFIAPHVYRNRVRPDLDLNSIIELFRTEQQRVLRRDGLEHD
jgi:AcrR family transcriptional regulator